MSGQGSTQTRRTGPVAPGSDPGQVPDAGLQVTDAVLTAGLGVVLAAVLESGLESGPEVPAARRAAGVDAELVAVLEAGPVVVEPLVAGVLQSLEAPDGELVGSIVDPIELVSPQLLLAAQQLPAAQRARLAELAKAQYGLCAAGHRRTVRVVDSGRHARTELVCRSCEADAS